MAKIIPSAGALSDDAVTKSWLINSIKKAGKVPVERDSFYKSVKSLRVKSEK